MSRDLKRKEEPIKRRLKGKAFQVKCPGVWMSFFWAWETERGPMWQECGNEGDGDEEEFRQAGSYETT